MSQADKQPEPVLQYPPTRLAWTHPNVGKRATEFAGETLIATGPIRKDEVICTWGGIIVTTAQLKQLPQLARDRAVQVEDDLHLTSGMVDELADRANHSCNPNAGLHGQITLVAMRDIEAGEEICFDYAMSDGHPDFHMTCACGQPECRGAVTGDDWRRPDLQARYRGYFSPYLQRRIDALKADRR